MRPAQIFISLAGVFSLTLTDAKIAFFWHITDLHYNSLYSMEGDTRKHCWRTDSRGSSGYHRPRGRYGDYACDSPWALIESAGQAMRQRQPDSVEFVLWTGDAISKAVSKYDESLRLPQLRNLTDLLGRIFSSQFVFPVLGHEEPNLYAEMRDLWQQWLPTEALQTFEIGGYYTIEQSHSKLRIVALNTNLMVGNKDKMRPGDKEITLMNMQWEWLEKLFQKSKANGETVYIVGHIPPGAEERLWSSLPSADSGLSEESNRRYLRLVRRFSSIIAGQFFGHLHSDSFRIMYNEAGKPVSWAMVAPSVSPYRANKGSNNPGLRLYKFDSSRGQVLDYTQYYLDLSNANKIDEAEWQAEYNLTNYYGLQEITAQSLHNLAETFTPDKPNSNTLFSRYFRANLVRRYDSPAEGTCDGSCVHTHYCAITRVDYGDYKRCIEAPASALASSGAPEIASATSAVALVLALQARNVLRRRGN